MKPAWMAVLLAATVLAANRILRAAKRIDSTLSKRHRYATLAIAYQLTDLLLAGLLPLLGIGLPHQHWNWLGKSVGIGFACTLLANSNWLRNNVGIRWRQAPGSLPWSLLCFSVCLIGGCYSGITRHPEAFSIETLIFEAFLPTIHEELVCRGIVLALLERSFGNDPMSCRLRFGWPAIIVSVLFGLGHGLWFNHGAAGLDVVPFVVTGIDGSIFAFARIRSGSLVWPMICHSAINLAIFAVAMAR